MDIPSRQSNEDYDSQLELALMLSKKSAVDDDRRRRQVTNVKLPPPPMNTRKHNALSNTPDLISYATEKSLIPSRPAPPCPINTKYDQIEDFIPLPPRPVVATTNFINNLTPNNFLKNMKSSSETSIKPIDPNGSVELIDLSPQTSWHDCSNLDLRTFDPLYMTNQSTSDNQYKKSIPNTLNVNLVNNPIKNNASTYMFIPASNNKGISCINKAQGNLVTPTEDLNEDDDLIFFSDANENLTSLSLCDFDPLYSVDKIKLPRSITPIPGFQQNHVQKEIITNSIIPDEWMESRKSLSTHHSSPDLHDPFSFEDLSMKQVFQKNIDTPKLVDKTAEVVKPKFINKKPGEYEYLQESKQNTNGEVQTFLNMVDRLKQSHDLNDPVLNCGYVLAAQTSHKIFTNHTVKLVVTGDFIPESIVFICDVNSLVEHAVSHVLLSLVDDRDVSPSKYALKVFGSSEYLQNDMSLCDYEYIQKCIKMGNDIKFVIVHKDNIKTLFKRTSQDNMHPVFVPKAKSLTNCSPVNINKLNILLKTLYSEIDKIKIAVFKSELVSLQEVKQVIKAICTILYGIETVEIQSAIDSLTFLLGDTTQARKTPILENKISDPIGFDIASVKVTGLTKKEMEESYIYNQFLEVRDVLIDVIKKHINMFCRAFNAEFKFLSFLEENKSTSDISNLTDYFNIKILSVHRLPQLWLKSHTEYKLRCSVCYGKQELSEGFVSEAKYSLTALKDSVTWNEIIWFNDIQINNLPRETNLCFTLIGSRIVNSSTADSHMKVNRPFAWVMLPLYNFKNEMSQGKYLLPMWNYNMNPFSTTSTTEDLHNCPLLQIELKEYDYNFIFPQINKSSHCLKKEITTLHLDEQEQLKNILKNTNNLSKVEREFLWSKKYYLFDVPEALPLLLRMVNNWSHYSLADIYSMIDHWAPLPPLHSLQLLLPRYPDKHVRKFVIERLKSLKIDEFSALLPQLVQALKFENDHSSALAELLLEKAMTNVRVAQHLYWYLKEASENLLHRKRYQLMFGALLSVIGQGMRDELAKEEEFVNIVSNIANKVKAAKDKEYILQRALDDLFSFLNEQTLRLPINPALEVSGVDNKSCSFFTSFTFPLKLALKNIEPTSEDIYVMFKVGDDLRQDMLTIQMINMMDQLWLQEGLDLKMVTFRCQTTSPKQGFVELLMESDTLGKIQKNYGHSVTGPFREKTISQWLQKHNPSELDYQRAVENFTASCAGYCIATFLLGICDRHNDNIMITHTGHIFHIDFAKFLGDLQTFGAINRDRSPFVLTSDMAYVINGGDKPSEHFQHFIDLCCRAFNIIRKHSTIILNLVTLMCESGIPRLNKDAVKYIHEALMPQCSDTEAVAIFTKMIHSSLKCIFTQFNFFIHNLAQLKFSGHDDGALLSFISKTYSIQTDGKIEALHLHQIQKRYSPEKFYVYIIKIDRENQRVSSYVLRRYSEFHEFQRKLAATFPLVPLPTFSAKKVIGRSHVRAVAETRKYEIEDFIKSILRLAPEVRDHDLVYTFFHPMLRDEQEIKMNQLKVKDVQTINNQPFRKVEGSIKINLFYRNNIFTVMIMHIKDLGATSNDATPNPYVKLYLLPDPTKETKRKTKIFHSTFHPTYNEMFTYEMPLEVLYKRTLQITVRSHDPLKGNELLGAVHIILYELDLLQDCVGWHKLQTLHVMET